MEFAKYVDLVRQAGFLVKLKDPFSEWCGNRPTVLVDHTIAGIMMYDAFQAFYETAEELSEEHMRKVFSESEYALIQDIAQWDTLCLLHYFHKAGPDVDEAQLKLKDYT